MGQPFGFSATVVAGLRLQRTVKTPPVELNEHLGGILSGGNSRRIELSGNLGWFNPWEGARSPAISYTAVWLQGVHKAPLERLSPSRSDGLE
jgi:hypothetical protein